MCGIFGFLGRPADAHLEIFHEILRAMAIMSVSRGSHATGFTAVHSGDPMLTIDKRPIPSPIFIKRSLPFKLLRFRTPSMLIGHTRQATSGDPKHNRNNHPFTSGRYTLVHNGKVEKHDEIAKKRNLLLRTETDSELLIKILDAYDTPLPAIREIANLELAIATAFISHKDVNNRRLYLFRNTERPLVTIHSKLLNTLFFISTEQIWEDAIVKVMRREKTAFYKYLELTIAELTPYLLSEITIEDGKVKWLEQVKINPPIAKSHPPQGAQCGKPDATVAPPEHKLLGTSVTPTTPTPAPAHPPEVKIPETPPALPGLTPAQIRANHHNQIKRIISLIRDEPFMHADEARHWEEWRYKIVVRPN